MTNKYLKRKAGLLVMLLASGAASTAQTTQQKEQIRSKYDLTKLNQMQEQLRTRSESQKLAAIQEATRRGWPLREILSDGRLVEIQKVVNGQPIYYTTYNVDAARSTRTDHLHTGGSLGLSLLGQNMTAHVWDGGLARSSHQEYDGAGGSNRFSIGDGTTAMHYHAAHVTGTIISSGVQANAKGMAPHSRAIGYDWNNDLAEATTAAASGMLVSNHSYGFATRNQLGQVQLPQYYFGGYINESRGWDELMFNAPNFLMVVAAGNDGNDNTANNNPTGGSGFDKLTGHSTSKNNLVVANAQDANVAASGDLNSVVINSSSSEGPTDDFRIKPDITGNGTSVYSTYESSNTAYNSITGTSMASPNVAGTMLLLQQHYNNKNGSFARSATIKGVALHTADDAGVSGPDAVYGWGLLNAKRAAQAISQNGSESKVEQLTLSSGQTYTINVDADGVNPLVASISWTDRPGTANTGTVNLTTPVLVNDLDIRVTKSGSTYYPYKLTGATTNTQADNNVDPFERVDVSGATGSYTITVTHKGSLTGGSQDFTIIVTGLTGTPVVCNATVPSGLNSSSVGSSTGDLSWTAVAGASYDVRYREVGGSWTTSAVIGTSTSLSGLSPLTSYEAQVRSKCEGGATSAYSSSVNFTTTEVQLNYCSSNGNSTSDEYIGRVQLGTINNSSGASSGGYGDHTGLSTDLAIGASNTVTITPTWTGTTYNEGYGVWIDYNKDGDFTDSGEQVFTASISKNTPVSGSFTVPNGTATGNTRMRVSMKYNGVPTSCESFQYGEVEDYTVNITGVGADTQAPSVPSGIAASSLAETSFTVSWTASTDNVGVTGYDVFVDGSSVGSVTSTTANITGLSVNTTYAVTVRAKDAAGNNSASSSTLNVTTPDQTAPSVPSGLAAANTTQTSTDLSWTTSTDNVGVASYEVLVNGSVDGTTSGTTYSVSGLTASTTYAMTVRAKDAAGNTSASSSSINVTTEAPVGGGCSGGIASFPYSEGFESGIGAWTQATSDDIDWTIDANGTPSNSTGPSSATEGSNYLYIESSGNGTGFPNKVAILSTCVDLSAESAATFSFSYHMYGSSMGSLNLEASINGTSWTSLWSMSGDQGNTWKSTSVDLTSYAGSTVQLRFVGTTSTSYRSDMALDKLSITSGAAPSCTNVSLSLTFDNYPEETSWSITDGSGATVASGAYSASNPDGSTVVETACLAVGCYTFTINDQYGDGICCNYGNGSYNLADASGTLLASGGSFTSSQATNFCVGGASNSLNSILATSSTGVERFVPAEVVRLYPNPVIDMLFVNAPADMISMKIITAKGQEMNNVRISQNSIDVSELNNGVYMLMIQTEKGLIQERFIKQ